MGFGLIFAGFLSVFFLRIIPIEVIGYLLMIRGLQKLLPYGDGFRKARNAAVACFVYALMYAVYWVLPVMKILPAAKVPQGITLADHALYNLLLYIFLVFLYRAYGSIAQDIGYEKGKKGAKNAFVTASVYIVLCLFYDGARAVLFFFPDAKKAALAFNGIYFAISLYGIIWLITTAVFCYSCYARIVTDDILENETHAIDQYNAKFGRKGKK